MTFRIAGIDPAPFRHLYGLSDEELANRGARRCLVDTMPGFPDRIELRDLEPGEHALLVNYMHQPANTPYRASHAIFVCEGAETAYDATGAVPQVIRRRTISLRAFDAAGEMRDADLVEGTEIEALIERLFADPQTAYLHAHYARRGCFAARIDRS
jgi:hypothetical protein